MSKHDKINSVQLFWFPMWTIYLLLVYCLCAWAHGNSTEEETVLYYYGIEESERGLAACAARQACGARVRRYWRGAALLRLCRCARRRGCDDPAPDPRHTIEINNRAHFQFCEPIDDWPKCAFGETALVVNTTYDRMDPDELEELHHRNVQLTPPKITFNCKCPEPNYWKLKSHVEGDSISHYKCGFLPICRTGEFCGNVDNNMFALYQSCLCPKHHICVHNGGVKYSDISELLYHGKGLKAYCQRISDDDYEDY